ncbi:lysostaphin resistance A-like protein [Flavobacterium sp.]|uniref:CPBP family intramembrane glutamic endopeptidase n=1 Tax=Flavobacterium sp. TaxID=239 RepID=UPI0039E2C021
MFIAQAIKPGNHFGKYLLGLLIIFIASLMGQTPFGIAVFVQSMNEGNGLNLTAENMMSILEPNLTLFLLLISYIATLGATFFAAKYLHGQSIVSLTTSRNKIDWSRVFFAFTVWGLFTVVTTGIAYWAAPEDFVVNFKPVPFLILLIIGTLLIPIQTSSEEYIFRGYLMQGLGLVGNRWFPLLLTSVIFGSLHLMNPEVTKMGYIILIYYIGTGLFLGILTLMDEGMELALGFHAANNLFGALLVTSDWTVFQTHSILKDVSEPSAGVDVLLPVLVIFPILLFIFSKKYGWSDWAEKLTGKIDTRIDRLSNTNTTAYGNHDADTNLP